MPTPMLLARLLLRASMPHAMSDNTLLCLLAPIVPQRLTLAWDPGCPTYTTCCGSGAIFSALSAFAILERLPSQPSLCS